MIYVFKYIIIKKYDSNKLNTIYISNAIFVLEFTLLFLIFALRHQSMGIDLSYTTRYGYLGSYDIISSYSWYDVINIHNFLNYEKGYIIYNKLISSIYSNRQFFLAVTAFLVLFPPFSVMRKYSCDFELSIVILMGIPVFLQYFSGLRQALAVAFCIYSYNFVVKKNLLIFISIVLFACCFHSSALVFFVAYPLYYIKINGKFRWISLCVLSVVWIFRITLFPVLASILNKSPEIIDTKAVNLLIFFIIIYVCCFLFAENNKSSNGLLNYLFVACFVQLFASINSIAMRVGYYYMFFLTLLLPSTIKSLKFSEDQRRWLTLGVFIFFYGFCWHSLTTSQSAKAVPYYFFWEYPEI